MSWIDSLLLGALQGFTEFLPISSSGHLVLGEHYLGLNVSNLKSFDVVVHMGTLLAILIYFRVDIRQMILSFFGFFTGKFNKNDEYTRLIFYVIIGSIPAVFAGLFLGDLIDVIFRDVRMVAWSMVIVALLFILGEFLYKRMRVEAELKWWKAIVIGLFQAVALIPGVSRSGSTIVAGLFQGVDRSYAARFSFLLGAPVMFGAGLLTAVKASNTGLQLSFGVLFLGFISSFIFGYISVSFLMKFLKKHSLLVFAVYLLALGTLILSNIL